MDWTAPDVTIPAVKWVISPPPPNCGMGWTTMGLETVSTELLWSAGLVRGLFGSVIQLEPEVVLAKNLYSTVWPTTSVLRRYHCPRESTFCMAVDDPLFQPLKVPGRLTEIWLDSTGYRKGTPTACAFKSPAELTAISPQTETRNRIVRNSGVNRRITSGCG